MDKYHITVKEFSIKNSQSGENIYGKLYCPEKSGKCPAVILSHGFNGSHADFEMECRYYAEHGILAYAYDFCGGSVGAKSDGKTTDMTIFTEKSDLLAVFHAIWQLEQTDSEKIFLFGGSQGGLVTALATEELKGQVRAMALYYPALNIPEDWRATYREDSDIPEITELWGMELGKKFFLEIRDFYTFDELGGYEGDVLIIYGSEDPIVPSGAMDKAVKAYPHVDYVVLQGEGHGFSPEGAKTAMEKVLDFLMGHV